MARQSQLVRAFVELADTLVPDYNVVDFLGLLCRRCIGAIGLDGAGVALADDRGRLALVGASSDRVRELELFEVQRGQGPCAEAFETGKRIVAADLEKAAGRWPQFTEMALRQGLHSAAAFPLRLRAQRIGALDVFRLDSGGLDEPDLAWLEALADVASIGILQERTARQGRVVARQLEHALERRVAIEQAKGIVGATLGVRMPEALELIRRFARQRNRRLHDVARELIDGTLLPTAIVPADDGPARR